MSQIPVYQWPPTIPEIARRAGILPSEVIRFDQNASPHAPPWVVEEATRSAAAVHEYPGGGYPELREAVGAYLDIAPERVVVGAGADELLLIAAKAFLGRGGVAVADVPTYGMYRIATLQMGAAFTGLPRDPETLEFPTADLARAAARADVTWLCLPNNPVGDRPGDDQVEEVLAAAGGVVVIDGAYAEFTGDRWRRLAGSDGSVVVIGTLSKAFGLAGIRVGYAVASEPLVARLHQMRPPGSISVISAALAIRGLADLSWMKANVAVICREREELAARLARLGLQIRPTVTNFVLARAGAMAPEIGQTLIRRHGLAVRTFPPDHYLADHLRITVRTPADHDRLIQALEDTL
jgi:histidinol-phosphate aminotransferase